MLMGRSLVAGETTEYDTSNTPSIIVFPEVEQKSLVLILRKMSEELTLGVLGDGCMPAVVSGEQLEGIFDARVLSLSAFSFGFSAVAPFFSKSSVCISAHRPNPGRSLRWREHGTLLHPSTCLTQPLRRFRPTTFLPSLPP